MATVSDDVMKGIVAKAIFETIAPEDREKLLQNALKTLIEPQEGQYGRPRQSRLQDAFDNAAYTIANQVVRELFEKDETVKARMKQLFVGAVAKTFDDEQVRDGLVNAMSRAFAETITKNMSRY